MASALGSSSRPHGPQEGDWQSCLVPHLQLSRLQTQGYLPLTDLVSVRAGLASIGNDVMAENFLNPNKEERVCFVPFLLWGLGFPIHPFLRAYWNLWHPTAQPYPRFDSAHLRFHCPL